MATETIAKENHPRRDVAGGPVSSVMRPTVRVVSRLMQLTGIGWRYVGAYVRGSALLDLTVVGGGRGAMVAVDPA
ncbi:hypothetical protein GCM10009765_72200 [Fodinicola feengrottensis]|uniref:Uncharacterized protein n=1 Tax=Fodinicola feengrottensis TaxID=435914 RepID=A0ABN2IVK5_9ACTN